MVSIRPGRARAERTSAGRKEERNLLGRIFGSRRFFLLLPFLTKLTLFLSLLSQDKFRGPSKLLRNNVRGQGHHHHGGHRASSRSTPASPSRSRAPHDEPRCTCSEQYSTSTRSRSDPRARGKDDMRTYNLRAKKRIGRADRSDMYYAVGGGRGVIR